jgi:hypothetical protein
MRIGTMDDRNRCCFIGTRYNATLILLLVGGFVLCPGCGPKYRDPATGVEARYHWETLRAELDAGVREVYPAARAAVDTLDLRVLRSKVNGIAAEIVVVDAHLDTTDIRLEAMPDARTLLTIRVSLFGNRNKSFVLFQEITRQLARSPAVVEYGAAPRYDWSYDTMK